MKTFLIIFFASLLLFDAVGIGIVEAKLPKEIWGRYKYFAYKMVFVELAILSYLIIM